MVEELIPAPDPEAAWQALLGKPGVLWLDSAAEPATLGRYSFLTADPWAMIRSTGTVTMQSVGGCAFAPVAGDALTVARRALAPWRHVTIPGLPPFQGGAAGYIGYDWGRVLERLPSPRYEDLDVPDVVLGLYDWTLAWDHAAKRAWLISTGAGVGPGSSEQRAADRLKQIQGWLAGGPAEADPPVADAVPSPLASPESYPVLGSETAIRHGVRSTFSRPQYLDAVARVREYILAGDIFQANLSQRFQATLNESAAHLYARLRRVNPAAFAAYLDLGGVQILSASPERFLRVEAATRMVETRPIKGTSPRGTGPMHDAALGQALIESEKDRAENLMIVDLLRNDLSRVCKPGTVRAPELFALEHHPTVHHLVSTVVGELEEGNDAVDLLHAAFPGGSITGAPKVRAMEIIAELEPTRRAVYCGSIGYLGFDGALDTSIVIRTYLIRRGTVFFQAGGGIVADSEPAAEYQETLDKARGLMDALG
ncbi:MAG: aminodeoxychorismate synthase component I [Gemmatimonadota bacterium]